MAADLGAAQRLLDWSTLANRIRVVDGNHDLGAGELAARLVEAMRSDVEEALRVAGEEAVATELRRLGIDDRHIVEFRPDGYGLQHPLRCHPNLIDCDVNRYLADLDGPGMEPGRWVVLLDGGVAVYEPLPVVEAGR